MNYHFVRVSNPVIYRCGTDVLSCHETETRKLMKDIVEYEKPSFAGPAHTLIKNVTLVNGIVRPIPIICELKGDMLEDIITKKQYPNVSLIEPDRLSTEGYSDTLQLECLNEISRLVLEYRFNSLTEGDLKRYAYGMEKLEKAIKEGYQKDMERIEKDAKENPVYDDLIARLHKKLH